MSGHTPRDTFETILAAVQMANVETNDHGRECDEIAECNTCENLHTEEGIAEKRLLEFHRREIAEARADLLAALESAPGPVHSFDRKSSGGTWACCDYQRWYDGHRAAAIAKAGGGEVSKKPSTNAEVAVHIRRWLADPMSSIWSWPTDGCTYEQHIAFVKHRNANWKSGAVAEFRRFVAEYADSLDTRP